MSEVERFPLSFLWGIRSKSPELLQASLTGDALMTRLECEWWMPFRG